MGLNSCEQYTITWTYIPSSSELFFDLMLVLRPEKLLSTGEAVAVQAVAEIALRCSRRPGFLFQQSGLEVAEAGCFRVR
jgi:hypothetical protein